MGNSTIAHLLKIFILSAFFSAFCLSYAEKTYKFFTPEDYKNARASAASNWGRQLLKKVDERIEGRAKLGFEIPDKQAGRKTAFSCPVHKTTFVFRPDSPHRHLCRACSKEYEGSAIDAAWRNYYQKNMQQFIRDCTYAYMASGNKKYFNYLREIFLKYAKLYPNYPNYTDEQIKKRYYLGKMYDQFLEDAIWFCDASPAYEVIRDKLSVEERAEIEKNLFEEGANMIMKREGGHNWRSWNNAMRASVAVILKDEKIMREAIYGKSGYVAEFEKMVFDDGWFKEASATYHFFPLKALQVSALAARAFDINLFDAKFENMFLGVVNAMYADMTFPAHNDCVYKFVLSKNAFLYELLYAQTSNKKVLDLLSRVYVKTPRISAEALLTNADIKPNAEPLKLGSFLFKDTGVAVLRSDSCTLIMKYGLNQGGHTHPDRLSITLHDGEGEILLDTGTYNYSHPEYRNWYRQGLSHNMLLVDGKNPNIKGAESAGKLLYFEATKNGGKVGVSGGKRNYDGVKLTRELQLNGNVALDKFEASSEEEHVYDYVFNLSQKPEISGELKEAEFAGESPAYEFIKNVKSGMFESGEVEFKSGDAFFRVKNKLKKPIELFFAKAPNIVYPDSSGIDKVKESYMLVFRTRGNSAKLETSIKLSKAKQKSNRRAAFGGK